MSVFLIIVGILVICYLAAGMLFAGFAVYYMAVTRSRNSEYAHQFEWWATATFRERCISILLAIWYGVICWLPIAADWMTRPTQFKFR